MRVTVALRPAGVGDGMEIITVNATRIDLKTLPIEIVMKGERAMRHMENVRREFGFYHVGSAQRKPWINTIEWWTARNAD